jgi:hypothetical protein
MSKRRILSNQQIFGFVDLMWTGPNEQLKPSSLKLSKLVWANDVNKYRFEILIDGHRSEWFAGRGIGYMDLDYQMPMMSSGGPSSGPAFGLDENSLEVILEWFDLLLPPHRAKLDSGELSKEKWNWACSYNGYRERLEEGCWEWGTALPSWETNAGQNDELPLPSLEERITPLTDVSDWYDGFSIWNSSANPRENNDFEDGWYWLSRNLPYSGMWYVGPFATKGEMLADACSKALPYDDLRRTVVCDGVLAGAEVRYAKGKRGDSSTPLQQTISEENGYKINQSGFVRTANGGWVYFEGEVEQYN